MLGSSRQAGGVGAGGTLILPGGNDTATGRFWDGIQRGRLLLQQCRRCGHCWHPMADVCEACRAIDVQWRESRGDGMLYSYTLVHHAVHPLVQPWIPYTLCLAQLDEGPRILATIEPDDGRDLAIGSRLRLGFRRLSQDFQIPVFHLVP